MPAPRNPPLSLPDGLQIEEYPITSEDEYVIEPEVEYAHRYESGGWFYWPHGGMLNGQLVDVRELNKGFYVTLGGQKIFHQDCPTIDPMNIVITGWVYNGEWIAQVHCEQKFDVYWNGRSLNESKGYDQSFAFQLLDGKPFYMWTREDKVWMNYDGADTYLGYDEVKLTYCCMTFHPPQHYERMITFYAKQGDQLLYIAIGKFKSGQG